MTTSSQTSNGVLPLHKAPQAPPLSGPICSQAEARAAGLDIAPSVEELDAMASTIVAAGDPLSAEVSLAQAVPLVGAAVTGLRARVAELEAAAYGDAKVRLLAPVDQIRHLHACVTAQKSRADTLDRLCREQRTRADAAQARLAEQERPADEDPIAYALTDEADGITWRLAPVQALRAEPGGAAC